MPTQLLSAIAGVTVYSSKVNALSGAVDSGAAFNTWVAGLTPSVGARQAVIWDGWIYVADGVALQYCPTSGGYIDHSCSALGVGGAVWQTKTTAKPCLWNGTRASAYSAIANTDITFTNLSFDFNYQPSNGQPHDDGTWGYAVGMLAAGIRRLKMIGCALSNPRTFTFWGVALDSFESTSNITTSLGVLFNFDGYHINGPSQYINIHDCTLATWDDSIAFNCHEPVDSVFRTAPWLSVPTVWTGGPIVHARVTNIVEAGSLNALRLLNTGSVSAADKWNDIVIDGISGTCYNNIALIGNLTGNTADGPNYGGSLTIRNITVNMTNDSDTIGDGGPGRIDINTSVIDNLTLDLKTMTGYTSNITKHPYIAVSQNCVFNTTNFLPNFAMPGELTAIVDDNFHRANGAPGNGWTDRTAGHYAIVSNQLANTGVNGANQGYITQDGASAADSQAFVDFVYNSAEAHVIITSVKASGTAPAGSPDYEAAWVTNTLGAYSTPNFIQSTALINGHVYRCFLAAVGDDVIALLYDLTAGAFACASSMRKSNSSGSLSTPGVSGINTIGYSAVPQLYNRFKSDVIGALPTLTAIALSAAAPVGGYIQITPTPTPSNAYDGAGVWAVTAGTGTVDGFGRYFGSVSGTVTYTVGGITGTVSFNYGGTMANEIQVNWTTGVKLSAVLYNAVGQVWTGANTFATPTNANIFTNPVSVLEQAATGQFYGTFPAGITTPGDYNAQVFVANSDNTLTLLLVQAGAVAAGALGYFDGTTMHSVSVDVASLSSAAIVAALMAHVISLTPTVNTIEEALAAAHSLIDKNVYAPPSGGGAGTGSRTHYMHDQTTVLKTQVVTVDSNDNATSAV